MKRLLLVLGVVLATSGPTFAGGHHGCCAHCGCNTGLARCALGVRRGGSQSARLGLRVATSPFPVRARIASRKNVTAIAVKMVVTIAWRIWAAI